jgi:hypothetical protein
LINSLKIERSWFCAIKNIDNINDRVKIYDAIFNYAFENKKPELSIKNQLIWNIIRPQIDKNIKDYNRKI